MTLIVGIRCSDGVVMGADGGTTAGAVIQPTVKLQTIGDNIIMGTAGPRGLGQLYRRQVELLWNNQDFGVSKSVEDAQKAIRDAIQQEVGAAKAIAQSNIPLMGQQPAVQQVDTSTLVAVPVGGHSGRSQLIRCDWRGNVEAASNDLPYFSLGSGFQLAEPFLAFLRNVFWPNSPPTIANGVLSVVWTLVHSIRFGSYGLSDPIQIVVKYDGKQAKVRELSQGEVDAHREEVSAAEAHLKGWREGIDSQKPIPSPRPEIR